jgi:hypothetical protein
MAATTSNYKRDTRDKGVVKAVNGIAKYFDNYTDPLTPEPALLCHAEAVLQKDIAREAGHPPRGRACVSCGEALPGAEGQGARGGQRAPIGPAAQEPGAVAAGSVSTGQTEVASAS